MDLNVSTNIKAKSNSHNNMSRALLKQRSGFMGIRTELYMGLHVFMCGAFISIIVYYIKFIQHKP